jgi:hypothetical protein
MKKRSLVCGLGRLLLVTPVLLITTISIVWSGLVIRNNAEPGLHNHLDEFFGQQEAMNKTAKPASPHYLLEKPTNHSCDGFKGILHIQSGDKNAAAAKVFFQYVINQLIYAEIHGLLPWIHLNNVSQYVYDPIVHGGVNTTVKVKSGMEIGWDTLQGGAPYNVYPGPPYLGSRRDHLTSDRYGVSGNGVWESYFEPVSDFRKGDTSCHSKPVVSMTYTHLIPGIHFYAPWAVRSWQTKLIPPQLRTAVNQTQLEWFQPMRIRANSIVKKYFRFQPYIVQVVNRILPRNETCLAMHIRRTDKAGVDRQRIRLAEFLPYAQAFLEKGGNTIYLATDAQNVISKMRGKWEIEAHVKTQGDDSVVRSNSGKSVFKIGEHHRTNTEVLTDVLAMSKCQFLIHGYSAVSESAIYLNLDLHNRSVNLEDPNHMNVEEFGALVQRVLEERNEKHAKRKRASNATGMK